MDGSGWEYLERCSKDYDKSIEKLNKQIERLQEQLDELQNENNNLCNDIVDLNLTIDNKEKQLDEANEVIKGYAECYKKYPDGTMFSFEVRKHPAHSYLEKWGVK